MARVHLIAAMDPGTAAAARLVLTLHATWADDARALLLQNDGAWVWPEAVVHPSLDDDVRLPTLLGRAVAQLRLHFGLAPHVALFELARTYGEQSLSGSTIVAHYHCHVEPAPGVVVPFLDT